MSSTKPQPAANVLRINLQWTLGLDTTVFNTFHCKFTGSGPTNADCAQLGNSVDAAVAGSFTLSQHPTVTLTLVTVTDLSSATAGTGFHVSSRPGTAGGGQLPAQNAVLVNYHIQRRYRGGKPRSYLPMGTDTDLLNPQTWATTAVTSFTSRVNFFLNALAALTWTGGNVTGNGSVSFVESHKWSQNNPPDGPWKSHPVYRDVPIFDNWVTAAVNPVVGTQRRRVRGKR